MESLCPSRVYFSRNIFLYRHSNLFERPIFSKTSSSEIPCSDFPNNPKALKTLESAEHDNQTVIFYEDRFEHAFNTSIEGAYSQLKKDKFDRNRAVRVRWIDEVIQGNIQGIEYCHIPTGHHRDRLGRIRIKRLYILWEENYIVWLEPRKENEWKFSSAYVANRGYIRKITRGYFCKKISRD